MAMSTAYHVQLDLTADNHRGARECVGIGRDTRSTAGAAAYPAKTPRNGQNEASHRNIAHHSKCFVTCAFLLIPRSRDRANTALKAGEPTRYPDTSEPEAIWSVANTRDTKRLSRRMRVRLRSARARRGGSRWHGHGRSCSSRAAGVPVHVFHGLQDQTVSPSHAGLYVGAVRQAQVHRLPGRDHQPDNELSEVARSLATPRRPPAARGPTGTPAHGYVLGRLLDDQARATEK
jgi:hypothetical protein